MGLITIILLVLFVLVSLLMMLVVLIQDDQGEGIAGMFGGASTTPLGSRSGNILTRFTSILGALFLFGAFALAWLNRTPESANLEAKARVERLRQAQQSNWWVEKLDQPAQPTAGDSSRAEPGKSGSAASQQQPASSAGQSDSLRR
jgi:preprotein translocase subunit SecG